MLGRTALVAAALAATAAWGGDDCLNIRSARETAYIVTDGENSTNCGNMGDTSFDAEKHGKGGAVVWFRIDDETWVVRDPAVAGEAQRLFAKVNEIGGRQGAIGAKQGRIGAEQGRIGMKQAEVALRATNDDARAADERAARMRELGERMAVLGKEQAALGEEMTREIAKAQRSLSQLLERAMQDGTAVRVRRL